MIRWTDGRHVLVPDDAVRLLQALSKRALESEGVDRVKFSAHKLRAFLKPTQECGTVLAKKRCCKCNRIRLRARHGAQVEKIPRLRLIVAVPHLLRDDLGARLEFDVASGMHNGVERSAGERQDLFGLRHTVPRRRPLAVENVSAHRPGTPRR